MDERTAEDQRVVQATLRGDTAAFGELVTRYQKLVAGAAWRYGVNRDEIEDLVSEVFFKVYRNLHQYRPSHGFATWLYRLAVNHVLDHGRKTRRERGRVEMPEQVEDPAPGPGEASERGEEADLVRSALDDVAPRYRDALFLVYVEGRQVAETARILGLPVGTVKSRLKRGRDGVRRVLVRRHPERFGGAS